MGKTSVDARRHIREWAEFFREGKAVTNELVEEFFRAHKARKHLKQSLRRLMAHGLVQKRGNKLTPTSRGTVLFLRRRGEVKDREKWDGKWRLISFDVPVKNNYQRAQLRGFLKEFNFFQLQKSVWVCPSYLTEAFWRLVVHYGLDKYCKVMLVEIIEGDEELRRYFKLPLESPRAV